MREFFTSFVKAVVLTALVTVSARGQAKIDKKPPGDLTTPVKNPTAGDSVPLPKNSKELLGGLVIKQLDAVREPKKNAIVITAVVANTSPFGLDRVTWTFSKWTGKEWAAISSSSGPGNILAKDAVPMACTLPLTNDAAKIKFEVRAATTKEAVSKEYSLPPAGSSPNPGLLKPSAKNANSAQYDKQLPGGIDTLFAWPKIVKFAAAKVDQKGLGDGQCTRLVEEALGAAGAKPGINYVWGTPVKTGQKILPGYIIQFTSCYFDNKRGSTWTLGIPNHTAIVERANGTTVTLLHQNVDGEPAQEKSHVRRAEIDLGWLVSGSYTIYRPVVK
jgi:hypothetical protein